MNAYTEQDRTYNGWASYETWLVNLWLQNDIGSYAYWCERAAHCIKAEEHPLYALSRELQIEVSENGIPDNMTTGLYGDLLGAALAEVDWREIAEHYLEDCED